MHAHLTEGTLRAICRPEYLPISILRYLILQLHQEGGTIVLLTMEAHRVLEYVPLSPNVWTPSSVEQLGSRAWVRKAAGLGSLVHRLNAGSTCKVNIL